MENGYGKFVKVNYRIIKSIDIEKMAHLKLFIFQLNLLLNNIIIK